MAGLLPRKRIAINAKPNNGGASPASSTTSPHESPLGRRCNRNLSKRVRPRMR